MAITQLIQLYKHTPMHIYTPTNEQLPIYAALGSVYLNIWRPTEEVVLSHFLSDHV